MTTVFVTLNGCGIGVGAGMCAKADKLSADELYMILEAA